MHSKRHNFRTYGSNNRQAVVDDTTSISISYQVEILFVPFCFVERTVTNEVCLKILKKVLTHVLWAGIAQSV